MFNHYVGSGYYSNSHTRVFIKLSILLKSYISQLQTIKYILMADRYILINTRAIFDIFFLNFHSTLLYLNEYLIYINLNIGKL